MFDQTVRPMKFAGHPKGANTVDVHPHLDFIATGGEDFSLKLWSAKQKSVMTEVRSAHSGPI